jgi:hypothetical protein
MEYLKKSVLKNDNYIDLYNKKVLKVNEYEKNILSKLINKIRLYHERYYELNNIRNINESYLCSRIENNISYEKVLLVFTKIWKTNTCFLINYDNLRDLKYYKIYLKVDNSLFFDTTILSGITYSNNRFHTLYLDNIHMINGKLKNKMRLGEKLISLNKILREKYEYDPFKNPFPIKLRGFFTLNHLEFIKNDCKLFFYPDNTYDKIFTFDYKYKNEKSKETIIKYKYLVKKDKELSDVYKLYKDNKFINILDVFNLDNSEKLKELFNNKEELELECEYNPKRESWVHIL